MTTAVHGETDLQSNATDQMLPGEYNAEMMYYAMAEGKLPRLLITLVFQYRIGIEFESTSCQNNCQFVTVSKASPYHVR